MVKERRNKERIRTKKKIEKVIILIGNRGQETR